jgi:3-isopropylmalate/(R)-2-methylmalate dehydratase small subunit
LRDNIKGRVWRFGSNVDTDQIIPAEYLVTGDPKELAAHAFEKVRPDFATNVREGDVIVADENFGSGSSREHAPRALIGSGVACVVAKSFARIFFRNSINIGLPLVEAEIEAKDTDLVEIDFKRGVIKNLSDKEEVSFPPTPEFLQRLIDAGGLVEYTKNKIKGKK